LKAREANAGADSIMVCERGASFGYNNLVSDMRSLAIMRETGCPVVFDATHSVQLPGGQGDRSGGQREFVPVLARAAVAVGVSGLFMETHPDPAKAMSDGPNAWPLPQMAALLEQLVELDALVKRKGMASMTKPAYMVVDARSSDPERMVQYRSLAQVAVAAYGGRYLVRGAPTKPWKGAGSRSAWSSSNFPAWRPDGSSTIPPNISPRVRRVQACRISTCSWSKATEFNTRKKS
jgi:hypothetical protein